MSLKAFLSKKIAKRVNVAVNELATDLSLYETSMAAYSSALYLISEMRGAERFVDRFQLLDYALSLATIDGDILEFGVHQGGSIRAIAEKFPKKQIYGFDSFEGLPEDWRSGFRKSSFDMQGNLPEVPPNVCLVKGWYDSTLPKWITSHPNPVSVLHIDCDLYSSTSTVLRYLSNSVTTGTVIIFDEYFNYPGWELGEHKAFMEWANSSGIAYEYAAVNTKNQQVAVLIK
jgi:hypothetical protein